MEKYVKMILDLVHDSGRTQTELARDLGISKAAVCKWYKGSRMPSKRHCDKILELINKDIEIIDKRKGGSEDA